jgi:hypothetical protein
MLAARPIAGRFAGDPLRLPTHRIQLNVNPRPFSLPILVWTNSSCSRRGCFPSERKKLFLQPILEVRDRHWRAGGHPNQEHTQPDDVNTSRYADDNDRRSGHNKLACRKRSYEGEGCALWGTTMQTPSHLARPTPGGGEFFNDTIPICSDSTWRWSCRYCRTRMARTRENAI